MIEGLPITTAQAMLQALDARGWATMSTWPALDLREAARLLPLGRSESVASLRVELISPKSASAARSGTMSAVFGLGPFPLHTERAHWRTPPRYMLLRSIGAASDRPTTLFDTYSLKTDKRLVQDLARIPWLVHSGDGAIECTVVSTPSAPARWLFRYDRFCMKPRDDVAGGDDLATRLGLALDTAALESHYWQSDTVLVIDNWRMLHGRGAATTEDFDRVLERVVVP